MPVTTTRAMVILMTVLRPCAAMLNRNQELAIVNVTTEVFANSPLINKLTLPIFHDN